jgi:plastocyanin
MRRFLSGSLWLSAPVVAGLLFLSGCGSEEKEDTPSTTSVGGGAKSKKREAKAAEVLEAPTNGTLRGKVILAGDVPPASEIKAMAGHNDKAVCLAGPEKEKIDQTWLIDPKTKGVADVYIRLVAPSGKKFKDMKAKEPAATIDQPHCAYVPHVLVVKPGQLLKVMNSSSIAHNTKVDGDPTVNASENLTINPGQSRDVNLKPQKAEVRLSCQIHGWMSAKVYVPDTIYAAVTKEDGSFEIPDVPTGVKLSIVGVHEFAEVEGGKEGKPIELKAGDNDVELKITPKK